MTDVQRFRIAPMTLSSGLRFLEVFPVGWIGLPVPFLMLGLAASGLLIPALGMPRTVAAVLGVAGLILPVFMVAALFLSRSASISIDADRIVVRGAPFGPSARLASLNLSGARAVDLRGEFACRPASGTLLNLPGYCAGEGSIGRGERAAWLLTDPGRVLYVPAREGRSLLISAESPEAIIEALRSLPTTAEG